MTKSQHTPWKKAHIAAVNSRRQAIGESRLTRAQASMAIVNEAKARAMRSKAEAV